MKELMGLIDRGRVLLRPEELLAYSYDATLHHRLPSAVLRPVNEEEISKILRFASEKGLAVTARGSGTALSGSSVPTKKGILLDLTLMNKVLDIDAQGGLVVVEPGVVYNDLNKALSGHGLFFPPDPGSGSVCTIGGMVSTNASGIRAVKYGTTRDYVQRLRLVLASGDVVVLGNLAPKSSDGYDLVGLVVGSEGTLGVVTEVTLKVIPLPSVYRAAHASFDSLSQAGTAVVKIMNRGLDPSVLEIMDHNTLSVIKEYQEIDSGGRVLLLLEMDGSHRVEVEAMLEEALGICLEVGASSTWKAGNDVERNLLWRTRRAAFPSLARHRPGLILEDITVPLSKVPLMLGYIEKVSGELDVFIATFGHAGDGNLHPTILVDPDDPLQMDKAHIAVKRLFEKAVTLGGTLSGEHGIGLSKKAYTNLEHDQTSLEVMKKLKKVFDPRGILNPDKIF